MAEYASEKKEPQDKQAGLFLLLAGGMASPTPGR
jgi:hypothetical protein